MIPQLGSLLFLTSFLGKNAFNPVIDLPTPKLIRYFGYDVETHEVITEDNFILSLHRIPGSDKTKTPVLLQHGLLGSSADWVLNFLNGSLARVLSDNGYDVWLGNARGNYYSRANKFFPPTDDHFWTFSWHEIGLYDLPASIDYILNKTGHETINYVGHSMGTTASYVLCSKRPDYNRKFKNIFSLSPVAFLSRTRSPIKYLAKFANEIEVISNMFTPGELLPNEGVINRILQTICDARIQTLKMCENSIFLICGRDPKQFNMDLLPVILGHVPSGTSTKTLVHFAQLIKSGKFREYDYGKDNIYVYGEKSPPQYDLSQIAAPVIFFYSDNDIVSCSDDVLQLYNKLPNPHGIYPVKNFNHLDFLWGKDVEDKVYGTILRIMETGAGRYDLNNEVRGFISTYEGDEPSLKSDTYSNNTTIWSSMWKAMTNAFYSTENNQEHGVSKS